MVPKMIWNWNNDRAHIARRVLMERIIDVCGLRRQIWTSALVYEGDTRKHKISSSLLR